MANGPELESLLAAVYASPDDDAPRLVLSDWLQERGDSLGEFIALQLSGGRDAAERAASLLEPNLDRWCQPLGEVWRGGVSFARGFPSRVVALPAEGRLRAFPGALQALFSRPPANAWATVQAVEVPDMVSSSHAPVARWLGQLEWLEELKASGQFLGRLARESVAPRRLRRIELAGTSGLATLLSSNVAQRAREVLASSSGRWRITLRHGVDEAPWAATVEMLDPLAREVARLLSTLADTGAVAEAHLLLPKVGEALRDELESRLARFGRRSIGSLSKDG